MILATTLPSPPAKDIVAAPAPEAEMEKKEEARDEKWTQRLRKKLNL